MRTKQMMSLAAVVFTLTGCFFPNSNGASGSGSSANQARFVQMFNCTHVNDAFGPPSGRAFNVFTRVDNGAWVARGGLNPQPGEWTDCHDAAHEASSLTLDLADPPGKWEVLAILLPRSDEPSCDSSAPDVPNACRSFSNFFQTNVAADKHQLNLTDGL
ncbi:hypothetical protein JYK02_14660 [Corallococcus macrosporus]|uniref:Lipoprotein n=1 Tax=Corallococcus macrosporus TaxID=35 RepID=A0ABS3DCU4_9BACT|nr:hypothetical protein [Corallococcus macrosporus]MBN8228747.1 hypothetical protein [Corallococcus macrosporus]